MSGKKSKKQKINIEDIILAGALMFVVPASSAWATEAKTAINAPTVKEIIVAKDETKKGTDNSAKTDDAKDPAKTDKASKTDDAKDPAKTDKAAKTDDAKDPAKTAKTDDAKDPSKTDKAAKTDDAKDPKSDPKKEK